ncbi:MAG: hypothetical protein GX539_16630 [Candidatus Cloacimonetes bacterium]|nr:hypothetical protein [Candidatus Cloacimonadota bacterium]
MNVIFFLLLAIVLLVVAGWAIVGLVTLLWYALIGFVVGMLGRMLVKDSAGLGVIRTIVAGLIGAIGGGLLASALDTGTLIRWAIVVLVSAIAVAVLGRGGGSRRPG